MMCGPTPPDLNTKYDRRKMMESTDVRSAIDRLIEADIDNADRDRLADTMATWSELRGWFDSVELKCVRRSRRLAESGRCEPAESMLSRQGNRSGKEAKTVTDRETVGEQMSGFEDALGDGEVSAGHLDAVAAATSRLDDNLKEEFTKHQDDLLAKAASETVDAFATRCRRLSRRIAAASAQSDADELDGQRKRSTIKRWVDRITGMHHTKIELDPIRDAKLWSVIDAHIVKQRQADGNSRTPWNQLQVNAFIAAVSENAGTSGHDDSDPGQRIPEITILIDWHTLTNDLHNNSVCEAEDGIPLPVSTVRRLCCDAEVLPVVLNGEGVALDAGRSKRTANRAQRRALRSMYTTCAHPDCTVGFSACRIHHIKWWWEHHGRTDLNNLLPVCERHHHLVHEGGWGLTMTDDRITTWIRPDGVVAYTGQSLERAPNGVASSATFDVREGDAA